MAPLAWAVAVASFLSLSSATAQERPSGDPSTLLERSAQHLVVVTDGPDATDGSLFRFHRDGGRWSRVGEPVPVVVGRSGVGAKREGDGRSPQGVFELGRAFGYGAEPPPGVRLPFQALAPGTVCVDDAESPFYNRILHPSDTDGAPWSSAEKMRRDLAYGDDLYKWGVVIRYNPDARPGAGSCIFFHVWRGPGSVTAGCTAMPEDALVDLMGWVDPGRAPVVVQGTRAYLRGLTEEGLLPYPIPGDVR